MKKIFHTHKGKESLRGSDVCDRSNQPLPTAFVRGSFLKDGLLRFARNDTAFFAGMTVIFLLVGGFAHAQDRSGDQGIGVMLGNPSGLSGKYWLEEKTALDAAVGVDQGDFDIHLSFLWHKFDWMQASTATDPFAEMVKRGELPVYFGVGPRILFADETELGVRFPVGVSYLPPSAPWEGFFEVAPVLRLTDSVGLDGDFAIGVRYYFAAIRPKDK